MPRDDRPDFDAFELSEARKQLLEQKAAIIRALPEWRPEHWAELKAHERWEALNHTESRFAALEKREAVPVSPLDERVIRKCEEARIDPPLGLTREAHGHPLGIEINPSLVAERSPDRTMLTYFHEEHHVEQLAAIRSPEARPDFSTSQKEAWEFDRNQERVTQYHRDIPYEEHSKYSHEQSARLESLRLYARCLNEPASRDGGNMLDGQAREPAREGDRSALERQQSRTSGGGADQVQRGIALAQAEAAQRMQVDAAKDFGGRQAQHQKDKGFERG